MSGLLDDERPPQRPLPTWEVGDRVVVAWHRREHAATVKKAGPRMYLVETDEPYNREGDRRMGRMWFELYEIFNDGSKP